MDHKLLIAGIAISLLVLGGLAIAVPAIENSTNMSQVFPAPGKPPQPPSGCCRAGISAGMNITMPDKSQADKFENAVLGGDYDTAKSLDEKYHFGGPLFGKLNQTTFSTYSQIAKLRQQLMAELGLNQTAPDGLGQMSGGMHGEPRPPCGNETSGNATADQFPSGAGPMGPRRG